MYIYNMIFMSRSYFHQGDQKGRKSELYILVLIGMSPSDYPVLCYQIWYSLYAMYSHVIEFNALNSRGRSVRHHEKTMPSYKNNTLSWGQLVGTKCHKLYTTRPNSPINTFMLAAKIKSIAKGCQLQRDRSACQTSVALKRLPVDIVK